LSAIQAVVLVFAVTAHHNTVLIGYPSPVVDRSFPVPETIISPNLQFGCNYRFASLKKKKKKEEEEEEEEEERKRKRKRKRKTEKKFL
jgi:hypothetical protein